MSESFQLPIATRISRMQAPALIVGLVACLLAVFGAFTQPAFFFPAYLYAYLFWLGITLGSLAMVMLFHLTGGAWGRMIGRIGEAASLTLPLMAILFIPILLGLHYLYAWSLPGALLTPEFAHRHRYLNVPAFVIRAVIYFLVWTTVSLVLNRWSLRESAIDPHSDRLQRLSGAGIVLYMLTMSLAAVDWIMSRDVQFFSSIFGFIIAVGQALAGTSFLIFCLPLVAGERPLRNVARPQVFIDLGNLILTLVILWAYMTFIQFLVIWMGNLQVDIPWYTQREFGNRPHVWLWISLFLIVFHFFVPFFILLFRHNKLNRKFLTILAGLLLAVHLVEEFWLVIPGGPHRGPQWHFSWLYLVLPVAIGGVWVWYFLGQWKGRALVPIVDPEAEEEGAEHE